MKNIKHVTPEGLLIYRFARKRDEKVYYSKTWIFIKWESKKAFYYGLGRHLKAAEKRAALIDLQARGGVSLSEIQKMFPGRRHKNKKKQGFASVGELMDVVVNDARVLNLDAATARSYANSLIKVVREALGAGKKDPVTTEQVRMQSSEILSDSTFTAFKRERARRAEDLDDQLKTASALRSANKDIRQAKAALSDEAQKRFKEKGLLVPDFKEWRAVVQFTGVDQKYRLPPVEVVRAIMETIKKLDCGTNLWKTCMLAGHAGFRNAEIAFARWSWFTAGTKPRIEVRREADFEPKRGHERVIEVTPWAYEALAACKKAGDIYVLSGDERERLRDTTAVAVQFLRDAGLEVDKPVHELRKWFGSWVAATRGLTVAQRQLGHDSYATTEKYYRDINFPEELLSSLWDR